MAAKTFTFLKYIQRIDKSTFHGWMVRIRKKGRTTVKMFSDKKYNGNWEASLDDAIAYRDHLVEKMNSKYLWK
jgi:hypothetical protein